jgi:YidC/Oxa1 family membrane protein insertase
VDPTLDDRRARRLWITLLVIGVAFGVLLTIILSPKPPQPAPAPPGAAAAGTSTTADVAAPPAHSTAATGTADLPPTAPPPPPTLAAALPALTGLHAVAPDPQGPPPTALGSLDPREARLHLLPALNGAGLAAITLSEHWEDALAQRQADRHFAALARNDAAPPPLPDPSLRYVLHSRQQLETYSVPVLAAHSVSINGESVLLFGSVWSSPEPGLFVTEVLDGNGARVLRIERRFTLGNGYDIGLSQRLVNLSAGPLDVQWIQYGPNEMPIDRSRYIDLRRFILGYLPDPARHPDLVFAGTNDLTLDRGTVFGRFQDAREPGAPADEQRRLLRLWPTDASASRGYELSWLAATNRYFTLAVHPPLAPGSTGGRSLAPAIAEIQHLASNTASSTTAVVFTNLFSPVRRIEPGAETSFDLGVYAGPLDRRVLGDEQPFAALNMSGMILYTMGGWCSWCTFQWLAHLLLGFLTFLHHWIVFDWGLAIIGLVIVVRTLLHPLTKKSQVSIQRFGKQMQAMKPEIDKLQQKYGNEPKRMQQEQLRLMREHGVSPFQALGCLPMFLQMPIWIALYAMLYFAFELRQQPAFFGAFQQLWTWQFLADLSAQDAFISLGSGFVIPLVNVQITSINLLPLLMAFVFYLQQKYMTPPPSATMTREQIQQQKIMKVMMVIMLPLFMYKVPSGLTLYIFTSSCVGILESRYIRRHIEQMDARAREPGAAARPPRRKARDAIARAYLAALERRKEKLLARQTRTFKKRR